MTVHDYYLSKYNNTTKDFKDWEIENQQRLGNKSYEDKYGRWLKETFMIPLGKRKNEVLIKLKEKCNYTKFYPFKDDLQNFPQNSTLIKISFILKKPYASKNESEFHIIKNINDRIFYNPIARDRFTGLPIVKPSTWKGHLRFAAEKTEWDDEKKEKIIRRLFGSEPGKNDTIKGRLYFFPTFFKEDAEREVITPLKRDTRTPTKEINLEVIKPDKKGEFYLMYLPFPKGNEFMDEDIKDDLEFLAEALKLMFYTYGFSAKKTSGFGVTQEKLNEGKIWKKIGVNIQEKDFTKLDELKNEINKLELK